MKYIVIYEKTDTGHSAYSPDLPGVIAADETLETTKTLMHEAMQFHIEGLREMDLPIPEPFHGDHIEYHEIAA